MKIRVGIAGAAGYTAGELIRILLHHPEVEISFLQSESHRGEHIGKVHTDLVYSGLTFSDIDFSETDVLFLCMGHGHSPRFLKENPIPERVKIIDLGNDFRLAGGANGFVYGLPELNKSVIKQATSIANPGCFATAIELGLIPLAARNILPKEVSVFGITGSTGAGQQPTQETHFSLRNQNLSNYKVFTHQHLDEVEETIRFAGYTGSLDLAFVPSRGCHSRGILVNSVFRSSLSLNDLIACYKEYYSAHPFVWISEEPVYLKQVVNTNYCFIYIEKKEKKVLITSVLDNLLKGASGQAVQNMNLMFGLDETLGLGLKAGYF